MKISVKKKIIFFVKADIGFKYGFGHLFRVLSIYKKLDKKKYDIYFFINDQTSLKKILKKQKIKKIFLIKKIFKNKFNHILNDSLVIFDIFKIKERKIFNFLNKIKLKKLICLDTFNDHKLIDIIINGISFTEKKINFKEKSIFQGFQYMCLPNYADKLKKTSFKKIRNVFLSSGGSDAKKIILKFIPILLNFKNIKINVLVGPGIKKENKIFYYKSKFPKRINLLSKKKNLIQIISKNDICLVSGGFIMLECLSIKMPTIVYKNYEHQKYAINYLKKRNAIYDLGIPSKINKNKIYDIFKKIENKNLRQKLEKNISSLIDGKGIFRVLKIIDNCF